MFTKEFKEALSHLPDIEKDKLILRLLKKDILLAERLLFELVDTKSVEERRKILGNKIINQVKKITETFYSIAYFNVEVRWLSSEITEHVKITKDKYGEASLNLLLLNEILKLNKTNILTARPPVKLRKFSVQLIARVFKVLLLINKMDADLLLDFKEDLMLLGNLISDNSKIMNTAIHHGLDVNWLLKAEIPNNIIMIHKEIKANGFLK